MDTSLRGPAQAMPYPPVTEFHLAKKLFFFLFQLQVLRQEKPKCLVHVITALRKWKPEDLEFKVIFFPQWEPA